jgi:hypothetical protein
MEPPRRLSRLFTRLGEAARGILRREKPPVEPPSAMMGLPPSARGVTGRSRDIAKHAQQSAREWEGVGEAFVQKPMSELGIPDRQIGTPNYNRGGERRAFLPERRASGISFIYKIARGLTEFVVPTKDESICSRRLR